MQHLEIVRRLLLLSALLVPDLMQASVCASSIRLLTLSKDHPDGIPLNSNQKVLPWRMRPNTAARALDLYAKVEPVMNKYPVVMLVATSGDKHVVFFSVREGNVEERKDQIEKALGVKKFFEHKTTDERETLYWSYEVDDHTRVIIVPPNVNSSLITERTDKNVVVSKSEKLREQLDVELRAAEAKAMVLKSMVDAGIDSNENGPKLAQARSEAARKRRELLALDRDLEIKERKLANKPQCAENQFLTYLLLNFWRSTSSLETDKDFTFDAKFSWSKLSIAIVGIGKAGEDFRVKGDAPLANMSPFVYLCDACQKHIESSDDWGGAAALLQSLYHLK